MIDSPMEAWSGLPATSWWEVTTAAGHPDGEVRVGALNALLSRYIPPLETHLRRRFGMDEPSAQDMLQAFLLEKVLQQGLLARVEPERGRFQAFLLRALDHYVLNQFRRSSARKRSPGWPVLPLHEIEERRHPMEGLDFIPSFDERWSRQVLEHALGQMEQQCRDTGCLHLWMVFEQRLLRVLFDLAPPVPYATLAKDCGFASTAQAMNALNTSKRLFNRILHAVVAQYVTEERYVDEELAYVKMVLVQIW
jgi:DNA-directed RNA polymerase specialized sigma24 family protein